MCPKVGKIPKLFENIKAQPEIYYIIKYIISMWFCGNYLLTVSIVITFLVLLFS